MWRPRAERCPSWPKERDWKSRTRRKLGRGFESRPLRLPSSLGLDDEGGDVLNLLLAQPAAEGRHATTTVGDLLDRLL
jgi:hypothetical protein